MVSVIGTIYIPFGSGIFGRWQYCYDSGWMVGSLRMLGFGSLGPGFAAWKEFCFFSRWRFLEGAAIALPLRLDAQHLTRAPLLDYAKAFRGSSCF